MAYVEIFGPPGAGKSTIFRNIMGVKENFVEQKDVMERKFLKEVGGNRRRIYNLAPHFAKPYIKSGYVESHLIKDGFARFTREFPGYFDLLRTVSENGGAERDFLVRQSISSAGRYQIGNEETRDEEVLCCDEGFAQQAVWIMHKAMGEDFPIEHHIRSTPSPDLLLYIWAPVQICIERQKKRGRVTVAEGKSENEMEKIQKEINSYCEKYHSKNKKVKKAKKIENIRSVNSGCESVVQSIKDM
jgi:thymidylate kinase